MCGQVQTILCLAITRDPHDGAVIPSWGLHLMEPSWWHGKFFVMLSWWSPHAIMRAPHDGALMPSWGLHPWCIWIPRWTYQIRVYRLSLGWLVPVQSQFSNDGGCILNFASTYFWELPNCIKLLTFALNHNYCLYQRDVKHFNYNKLKSNNHHYIWRST